MTRSRVLKLDGYVHCYRTWVCHLSGGSFANQRIDLPPTSLNVVGRCSCNFGKQKRWGNRYGTTVSPAVWLHQADRQAGGPVQSSQINGLARSGSCPTGQTSCQQQSQPGACTSNLSKISGTKLRLSPHCDWSACLHQHFFCTCYLQSNEAVFYAE